jgi:hypothetical protein
MLMKRSLPILLLLITLIAEAKKIVLPSPMFFYRNTMEICAPGDTLLIKSGAYGECSLLGITGTADKPVVVMNDGPVKMGALEGSRYGLKIEGSYFKLCGDADYHFKFISPAQGMYLGTSIDFNNSSNYEVSYLDIGYTQLGLRSNPTEGRIMENINIHHIRFHHTANPGAEKNRCEAIYFGNTDQSYTSVQAPMRFNNLHIHHCVFDSLMGDAIQIAIAENFRMDHDTVTNSGLNNLDGQFTCFLAGGCTQGIIDSCYAWNNNGPAVQVFGYGKVYIKDNSFIKCAQYKGNNQDVIYISSKCPDASSLQTFITGNIIDGGNRFGINNQTDDDKYVIGIVKGNTVINVSKAPYQVKETIDSDVPKKASSKKAIIIGSSVAIVLLLTAFVFLKKKNNTVSMSN